MTGELVTVDSSDGKEIIGHVTDVDLTIENGYDGRTDVIPSDDVDSDTDVNVVAIAGGSAAGKTTLAKLINQESDDALHLPLDDFYYDYSNLSREDRLDTNFDHPLSIDWTDLTMVLSTLVDGRSVEKPVYDFETGVRTTEWVEPHSLIVVDGLWAFEDEVDRYSDFNIYVETEADERLIRRIRRDMKERNKTVEQAIRDYEQNTKPSHEQFVEPQKEQADIIVTDATRSHTVIQMVASHFA